MTVKELREILSQYNDDVKVYVAIEDIIDNGGYLINSVASAKQIGDGDDYGIRNSILIHGIE